jgi:hypothetical protein
MKKILITTAFFAFAVVANAQVGIGTPTPNSAAALDVEAPKRGMLIPRVDLTSTIENEPIDVDAADMPESLLVYNENEENDVTPGFYYWVKGTPDHWERIVNQEQLDEVINQLYQNFENFHELINYIAPTNPDAPTPTAYTHHTVVWNEVTETFQFVKYDGNQYYTTDIDLLSLVQDLETNTHIEEANTGSAADGDLEIIFSYEHELHIKDPANNDPDLMNITQAIIDSIEGNTNLQTTITNLFEGGASVFYGTANGTFATPVLYYLLAGVPTRIDTAVVLDGIKNATDSQIREIKDELGNNYNTVVYTGDTWVDNKKIYKGIYSATVTGGSALLAAPINLDPSNNFTAMGSIVSIRLLSNAGNNIINTATTDVVLNPIAKTLSFRIGTGGMYVVLDPADITIKVLVEFSADE